MKHNSKRDNLTKKNFLLETRFLNNKEFLLEEAKIDEITKAKTEALTIMASLKNRHSSFVKSEIEKKETELKGIDPKTVCSDINKLKTAKSDLASAKSSLSCHPQDKTDLTKLGTLIDRIITLCESSDEDTETDTEEKDATTSTTLSTIFGGVAPSWGGSNNSGYENGPKNHGARPLGDWQSDNAWDIFAVPGTKVYAILPGTVDKVKASNKTSGKIFGTQVTVSGSEDYPKVFYTHLKNVSVQAGDTLKAGDLVGEISEWDDGPKMTHVHIGIEKPHHIKEYVSENGDLLKSTGDNAVASGSAETQTADDAYSGFLGNKKTGTSTLFDLFGSFGKMMTPKEVSEVNENITDMKKLLKKIL
jgi:hypothetical protein